MNIHKVLSALALTGALIAINALSGTAAVDSRVIEVIADKDNTFKVVGQKKPVITVKPREKIVLKITSYFGGEKGRDGSLHSFVIKKLRAQGWDIRLMEGTRKYPLVAPQETGEYLIECTVKCGRGHDDMKMKLIVRK